MRPVWDSETRRSSDRDPGCPWGANRLTRRQRSRTSHPNKKQDYKLLGELNVSARASGCAETCPRRCGEISHDCGDQLVSCGGNPICGIKLERLGLRWMREKTMRDTVARRNNGNCTRLMTPAGNRVARCQECGGTTWHAPPKWQAGDAESGRDGGAS